MSADSITRAERKVLRAAADIITRATSAGERVVIRGFGSFFQQRRKGRTGVVNGREYSTPDTSVIKFKPSKAGESASED